MGVIIYIEWLYTLIYMGVTTCHIVTVLVSITTNAMIIKVLWLCYIVGYNVIVKHNTHSIKDLCGHLVWLHGWQVYL